MKSKKGALFHWIVFGILLAVGVFVWLAYDAEIGVKVKGQWQLDFLRNYYVEGEEKLANIDQRALFAANKVILALADKGGVAENSKCGLEGGVYYWNTRDTFCFLEVDKEVNTAFNKLFQEQYGAEQSYGVSHQGEELLGKAENATIILGAGASKYSLQPHFRIKLNYNFDEYFQLQKEASGLVHECKAASELQDCLKKIMPSYWKLGPCAQEEYQEKQRKVPFCVESPANYAVLEDDALRPVFYQFGLDFSSV